MLMPMVWTNDVDNLLENMVFEPWTVSDWMLRNNEGAALEQVQPMRTDVVEEQNDYKMTCDLPGFNKEDIRVSVKDGVLKITASHKENKDQKDEKTGKYLRRERSEASFERSFDLGENVKTEEIAAHYENGVLTVTIPKKEAAAGQSGAAQIEVK